MRMLPETKLVGLSANRITPSRPFWRRLTLCLVLGLMPSISRAQIRGNGYAGVQLSPRPAIPAILAAFGKYEIVAMSEAHDMKDEDDFILSLIRNPAFPDTVNDIAVECGNSLYQPILDRYIAGEDVPFTEVEKVWRDTTQPMCGMSGFFEEFFPLVRTINQKLAPAKRIRVLACDPPVDWSQVKSVKDVQKMDRDASIASVMEKEVISKHRKALMLFGIFHLFHGGGVDVGNAVTIYEKDYPGRTFVIGDLANFDLESPVQSPSSFADWQYPSLMLTKGSWLGSLGIGHFYPLTIWTDDYCNVHDEFPKGEQKPMADLVDAFLYLGPANLQLIEKMPADIALDVQYINELLRREALIGLPVPKTLQDFDQQIVDNAASAVQVLPKLSDLRAYYPFIRHACLARKGHAGTPQ